MLPTLDRDGNDCRDREVVPGRYVSQWYKEACQSSDKEGHMKVGDLVKVDGHLSGYGSSHNPIGVIIENDRFGDSRIILLQLHDRDEWFDSHHCEVINESR